MLIKITNYCSMGCSHCMEDSTKAGAHMSEAVFRQALKFTWASELYAYSLGAPRRVLISGGECSEHPDFVKFVDITISEGFVPFIITNGMWLENQKMRAEILRHKSIFVQVTNDARFYPKKPPIYEHPQIVYVDQITRLIPLGRAARKKFDLQKRRGPASFNLRSLARAFQSYSRAVSELRLRTTQGYSGHCTPSVLEDGRVTAGETRNCFVIGTVNSGEAELTSALLEMECNRCGLEDDLTAPERRAIGQ